MKSCPKCFGVVKAWDIVCPVCKTTLKPIDQLRDSAKMKGGLPAWDGLERNEKEASGGEEEVEELEPSEIESVEEERPAGQIVVEGKQRGPAPQPSLQPKTAPSTALAQPVREEQASLWPIAHFPAEPMPAQAPPLLRQPHVPSEQFPRQQNPSFAAQVPLGVAPAMPVQVPASGGAAYMPQVAPPSFTHSAAGAGSLSPTTSPAPSPAGVPPTAGAPTLPPAAPKEPGTAPQQNQKSSIDITLPPPPGQQYDPEMLRRIMQQAQMAAMMRTGKLPHHGTQISLPLAIILIVMGTLSMVGLVVIAYLLMKM